MRSNAPIFQVTVPIVHFALCISHCGSTLCTSLCGSTLCLHNIPLNCALHKHLFWSALSSLNLIEPVPILKLQSHPHLAWPTSWSKRLEKARKFREENFWKLDAGHFSATGAAASRELSGKYLTPITAHWRSAFLWGVFSKESLVRVFSKSLHPEFYIKEFIFRRMILRTSK